MDISDKLDKTYSNIEAALKELSSEWSNSSNRRPKNQRAECLLENALGLLDEIKEEPWPLTSEDYIDE
ncbi:uncharacterized protein METZ01_LOCUS326145 [marine metagenome]|uniref:Uncharacterized protein n=1 Tax=marine metagenome TaxID=408172 RepID=A0A382PMW5_9ZZZZ